jgi:TRAP-type C4-dicarboxylate transport system permease small subunit
MKNIITGIDKVLANSMRAILIAVSIMVTCTMFAQVVSRYVFQSPIWGLDEITGHTAVWLYLIGSAYGSYEGSHIKAEFIHMFIKNERTLFLMKALAAALATVVACYMIVWSTGYVHWSVTKHELTPTLRIPTVIFQIPILISALLMALYFFVEMVGLARQAYRRQPVTE